MLRDEFNLQQLEKFRVVQLNLAQSEKKPFSSARSLPWIEGSVAAIEARLLLWCGRESAGLAKVEFTSEFARTQVMRGLCKGLEASSVGLIPIALPQGKQPAEILNFLLQELDLIEQQTTEQLQSSCTVVSIEGWATAFDPSIPRHEALRVINFNRENLVHPHVRQIWWMTRSFSDTVLEAMPDLNSWFGLRLFLTETPRSEVLPLSPFSDQSQAPLAKTEGSPQLSPSDLLPSMDRLSLVGRSTELDQLSHWFLEHNQVAIVGTGGMGKTALALQYAHQFQREGGSVCWLQGRGMDLGNQVIEQVGSLGFTLPDNLSRPQQVQWCWQHWPTLTAPNPADDLHQGKILVVVDDLDYPDRVVADLPLTSEFRVLFTSRSRDFGTGVALFSLQTLSLEAAVVLLRRLVGEARVQRERAVAEQLAEFLGCLPLGLELVGRYCQSQPNLSLQTLWQNLQAQPAISSSHRILSEATLKERTIAAVFELSWQALSPLAQGLGSLLSCFALAPIPWELVELCFPEQTAASLQAARDQELLALGLVSSASSGLYFLHPLVREFLGQHREQLAEASDLKGAYCQAMVQVAQEIPKTPTRNLILRLSKTIPHLAEAAQTWRDWLTDEDLIWPYVGLGRFYEGQGHYSLAEPWQELGLKIVQNRLGEVHPDTATSLNNLAFLYYSMGRYAEAEPLYVRSLQIREQQLGADHPDTASSLNNLALLYYSMGRYAEAEPLLMRSLQIREQQLGADHPDTASSLNNLALLYKSMGRYADAEPLYVRSLQICEQQLGADHPDTATSLNNLAGLYDSMGRYADAEPLYVRSLQIREQQLGADHPDTASSLNNLAGLYDSMGRYADADTLYVR
jgi:tetratricopeptide (TPR) repeat protein